MPNSFTITLDKTATSFINRDEAVKRIKDSFQSSDPSVWAYLLSGVRGVGKTVCLRQVSRDLSREGWLAIDLNPQSDLLRLLAEKLFRECVKLKLVLDWGLSVGFGNISLKIKKSPVSESPEIIVDRLLELLAKKGKRLLVTIDEASATPAMRYFANYFQSAVESGRPIFLLMTAIQENVDAITNDKGMSFISRAPRIVLGPLELSKIALEYQKSLGASWEDAAVMAKATNGYPFAYQVLGYFAFERHKTKMDEELSTLLRNHLWENGYDVIWRDLTRKEKDFLIALAKTADGSNADIMALTKMSESNYQNYRRTLIQRGYITQKEYGKVSFVLPEFGGYCIFRETLL